MRRLYIRPNCTVDDRLIDLVVTTTPGEPLVDEQIVEHFPKETSGREIREAMLSQYPGAEILWGKALFH